MANRKDKVLVIVGPTASGKTASSLSLAKKYGGEIICADSRTIYCGMDIGSAKITKKEMGKIRHHLIDIKNPDEEYNVGQFKEDAVKVIKNILKRKKLPIIVGGTAQYIYALVDNWQIPNVPPDEDYRKELENKDSMGLFKMLIKLDPKAREFIDPNNKRRIIRALEVIKNTGGKFSEQRKFGPTLFNFEIIGIKKTDEELKIAIRKRTDQMIKKGLVKEVQKLLDKGYSKNLPVLSGIGYKEIIDYLNGEYNLGKAVDLINKNTWSLVKHQMTWFKRDKRIKWIS